MKIIVCIIGVFIIALIVRAIIKANKERQADYNRKFYRDLYKTARWEKTENLKAQVEHNPSSPSMDARRFELSIREHEQKMLENGATMEQVKIWDSIHHPFSMHKGAARHAYEKKQKEIEKKKASDGFKTKVAEARADGRVGSDGSIKKCNDDDSLNLSPVAKIAIGITVLVIITLFIAGC